MINQFMCNRTLRHMLPALRRKAYYYDQAKYKCPHCGYDAPSVPMGYVYKGYRYTSNYARCINPYCKRVMRRYGHSLEEFVIRQWIFTCMLGRYYHHNENPYHAMNTRYPYPPMTHYAVFGTRD